MKKENNPTWIWYPGDFEIWQNMKLSLRRRERLTYVPVFWKLDTFYPSVIFRKEFILEKAETIKVSVDGDFHIILDHMRLRYAKDTIELLPGSHILKIAVCNQKSIPSLFVQGDTLQSNSTWGVTCYDGNWEYAGCWNLDAPDTPPSRFQLPQKEIYPDTSTKGDSFYFLDFGKEVYARLKLIGIEGVGNITVYYGESLEEAHSERHCVLLDTIEIKEGMGAITFELKAFRYAKVVFEGNIQIEAFSAFHEYLPVDYRGAFSCSDDLVNSIWDISRYTLHLNTREFFIDGLKRDGWIWSGDAYQSFLMNYYSFFDQEVCKRTLIALRGKNPIVSHINTIMDYTFYWFIGFYDYYLYTGDLELIRQNYKNMLSMMDFCLNRSNSNGMMTGLEGDWVFIDWADMNKRGEVCVEQILFCRSMEVMGYFSELFKDKENSDKLKALAKKLRSKILDLYWDKEAGGLVSTHIDGETVKEITKHANIFASRFGFLNEVQTNSVVEKVLLNKDIPDITTPYFRFYELEALCEAGEHNYVLDEIRNYWGGMLKLGATTFWEKYEPSMIGSEHYAMYGEPFDKSLCHAWGASPIYLLGKYYLGVTPLSPGYETYEIKPNLGSLQWMQGTVPAPKGDINIYVDNSIIKICATANTGYLRFYSRTTPQTNMSSFTKLDDGLYEIRIEESGLWYEISYCNKLSTMDSQCE